MERFKIGDAAQKTGLTTRTIRYYEEFGLLGQRKDRPSGKLRTFDRQDIARLRKIQNLKDLGLTLEEIAQVIDLYFTDGRVVEGKRKVIEILKGHAASAEEKINDLKIFKRDCENNVARLEAILKNYQEKPE
jgi:DNA-binding transcriptional MerR regulator